MATGSGSDDMDSYDAYLAELHDRIEVDRETRLMVLDVAACIEMELCAIVATYLSGGDSGRRNVTERNVARWGGVQNLLKVLRDAIAEHDELNSADVEQITAINSLLEVRNLIAHGRVETWHANHPELRDDDLGRSIYKRSRSGDMTWEWLSFEDAQRKSVSARAATTALGRRMANLGLA